MGPVILFLLFTHLQAAASTNFEVPVLQYEVMATMKLVLSSTSQVYVSIDVLQNGTYTYSHLSNLTASNGYHDTYSVSVDPADAMPIHNSIEATKIRLSSISTFQLQVYTEANLHTEGYNAIPVEDLRDEYFASSFCSLGGLCQLAIFPVETGSTLVYIQLPPEVKSVRMCSGSLTWDSAVHDSVNLTYPEVMYIETTHEIAGTHIYANSNIGVVVGARDLTQTGSTYHMVEQLPPIGSWGKSYQYVATDRSDYGDIVQIVSCTKKTIVYFDGYPTVRLPERGGVIQRRVSTGSVAMIRSNKPVQVSVFVGIKYVGSFGSSVAMSLVPAIETYKSSYKMRMTAGTGWLYLVTQTGVPSLYGATVETSSTANSFPYSTYSDSAAIDISSNQGDMMTVSNAGSLFGGVVAVGSALLLMEPAVMPSPVCDFSQVHHNPGDMLDNDCNGNTDQYPCRENIPLTLVPTTAGLTGLTSHTINITHFSYLNFRVLTCGVVTLRFNDASNNTVVLQIRHGRATLTYCDPFCIISEQIFDSATHRLCDRDLLTYTIIISGSQIFVSAGFDTKVLATKSLPEVLTTLTFTTLDVESSIWYDIMYADCASLQSDWRCIDLVSNCMEYDQDICNDVTYQAWTSIYCRKYCGVCKPDSYGKLFVAVPFPMSTTMYVDIVAHDPAEDTFILGYSDVDSRTDFLNGSLEGYVNHCRLKTLWDMPIFLYSPVEVSVKARFPSSFNLTEIPIQPVDALGTTYMTLLMADGGVGTCLIVPADIETEVYKVSRDTRTNLGLFSPTDYHEVTLLSSELNGLMFESSKPVAIFCGVHYGGTFISWYQLTDINTWGNNYTTPTYSESNWGARFRVISSRINTFFNVSGGFDGGYLLLQKGEYRDFSFDPNIIHYISSNFPVAVGIQYYISQSSQTDQTSTFQFLPPMQQFMTSSTLYYSPSSPSDIQASVTDLSSANETIHETLTNASLSRYIYTDTAPSFITAFAVDNHISIQQSTVMYGDLSKFFCDVTNGQPGDGVDNDCDGLVDEDVGVTGFGTLRQDQDIDGGFGEDCLTSSAGTSYLSVPEPPVCIHIEIPEEGCWEVCRCSCAWMNSLADYENMNASEQATYLLNKTSELVRKLTVEKESLSATLALVESADDQRTSSTNIGFVGIGVIVLVVGSVCFFDVITLVQKINNCWKGVTPE